MQAQQLLVVCETFQVILTENSYDMLKKLNTNITTFTTLPQTTALMKDNNFLFSKNLGVLESLVVERLNIPKTDIFNYLINCRYRIRGELGKSWSAGEEVPLVLKEGYEIVGNYICLAITTPELFESGLFRIPTNFFKDSFGNKTVITFLQLCLYTKDMELTLKIFEALREVEEGADNAVALILTNELSKHTIFDPEFGDMMNLAALLLEDKIFKDCMLNTCVTTKLKKGSEIEPMTFLGRLMSGSSLPIMMDPKMDKFEAAVVRKVESVKSRGAFEKVSKNIEEVYIRHRRNIHSIARALMKGKNGGATIMGFFKDTITLNTIRVKMAFQVDNNARKTASSDSFGLTALDVLLEFVGPIVEKNSLFNKVDFDFMKDINNEFFNLDANFFNNEKTEDKKETIGKGKSYKNTTRFFFYVFEYIGKFLVSIVKRLKEQSSTLQRLEGMLKKETDNFKKSIYEKQLKMLKTSFITYKVALTSEERIGRLNIFYQRFFSFILSQKTIDIPEHYLLDYVEVQSLFAQLIDKYYTRVFGPTNLMTYLNLLDTFLSPTFNNASPHIKAKFAELLFVFNMTAKGKAVEDLAAQLNDQEKLDKFVLSMIRFYSTVEFMTDAQETGQNKYQYRYFITEFLLTALEKDSYRKALKNNLKTQEVNDFIGHLLTDLNYFLQEAFDKVEQIKKTESNLIERELSQLTVAQNNDNTEPEIGDVEQLKSLAQSYFKNGRSYLKLFDKLASLTPEMFDDEEWAHRTGRVLNFYADKLSIKNYKKIKFDGLAELGLKPLKFIQQLVSIYVGLGFSERVKAAIIDDDRSFSKATLINIGRTALKRNLVNSQIINKFEDLILELEAARTEREDFKAVLGEVPDKFACELTYELMKHPVRLPDSKLVVDYSAIKQHITLNGETDPYTRKKLTLVDLEEMDDLQREIDEWMEKKRAEFRRKLKKEREVEGKGEKESGEIYSDGEEEDDKGLGI